MKYMKMLALTVVAMVAAMAFTGIASATQITSPAGTLYTGALHAETTGHTVLHTPAGTMECKGTISSFIEQHGPGTTAKGNVTTLSFTSCTNGVTVKVLKNGLLEFHSITGGINGTVTSTGAEFEVFFSGLGISCIYTTNSNDLGPITGGLTAVLHVNATVPRTGGSPLCGSSGNWTGSYKFTTPHYLAVDA